MKLLNTLKNFPSAQKFLWFSLFFISQCIFQKRYMHYGLKKTML